MKKATRTGSTPGGLRRQAERQLRRRAPPAGVARPERLLQELQIHQIELELQNEELKQAKADADASLDKYTDLYDFAPVGYFSLDAQGLILAVNLTGAALLGIERSLLTRRRFQLFVAPANRPTFQSFLDQTFAGTGRQACEVSLLRAGRSAFPADLQAAAAAGAEDAAPWCRVTVIDTAARKQAEEARRRLEILSATNRQLEEEIIRRQAMEAALTKSERRAHHLLEQSRQLQDKLRQMAHQILLVQENQRKEISRQLHDEISQLLLSISVRLAVFTKAAAIDPRTISKTVAPLRRLLENSVGVVHRFARDLRPAMLDDLGLVPALRSYIQEFPLGRNLRVEFKAFAGADTLDNDQRTVLYRVAQEALTNVAKHARARVVKVTLLRMRGGVCLEVADDGKAFEVDLISSAEWGDRLGLVGMRERVEMIGGRFSVRSAPGKGTTIRTEIPLCKGEESTNGRAAAAPRPSSGPQKNPRTRRRGGR